MESKGGRPVTKGSLRSGVHPKMAAKVVMTGPFVSHVYSLSGPVTASAAPVFVLLHASDCPTAITAGFRRCWPDAATRTPLICQDSAQLPNRTGKCP